MDLSVGLPKMEYTQNLPTLKIASDESSFECEIVVDCRFCLITPTPNSPHFSLSGFRVDSYRIREKGAWGEEEQGAKESKQVCLMVESEIARNVEG